MIERELWRLSLNVNGVIVSSGLKARLSTLIGYVTLNGSLGDINSPVLNFTGVDNLHVGKGKMTLSIVNNTFPLASYIATRYSDDITDLNGDLKTSSGIH